MRYTLLFLGNPAPVTVQDVDGPRTVMQRPQAVRPASFRTLLYAEDNVELWDDLNGTTDDSAIFYSCPGLRQTIIDQIKQIRAQALEQITKNSGVSAVYAENYAAALAHRAGIGTSTIMKDGQTATDYLAGFATQLGMDADRFADYIVAENQRVNPTAYAIEREYLSLAYAIIPACASIDQLLALPGEYRRYCQL